MNKKASDRLAAVLAVLALLVVSGLTCYGAGYRAAKAGEISTPLVGKIASSTSVNHQVFFETSIAIIAERRAGEEAARLQEISERAEEDMADRGPVSAPLDGPEDAGYIAAPGAEQWRSTVVPYEQELALQIWGSQEQAQALSNILDNERYDRNPWCSPESDGSCAYGLGQKIDGWDDSYQPGNWQQQVQWVIEYIRFSVHGYGDAVTAWNFKQAHGWY